MMPSLEESQAAPWHLWSVKSSQEPSEAWYQGWLGKLYHYKDGSFNMLLVVAPPLRLLDLLRSTLRLRRGANSDAAAAVAEGGRSRTAVVRRFPTWPSPWEFGPSA